MRELTGAERIGNLLKRQPVDRIGLFEHFWGDTLQVWRQQGHIRQDEDLDLHFGFDMSLCWPFNMVARLDFQPVVLEETEETIVQRDGNNGVLRRYRGRRATAQVGAHKPGAWVLT